MQARVEGSPLVVDQVEEHEWLEDLAEIRWAHQTRGVALGATTGTLGDRSRQARRRFGWVKDGHWVPLESCGNQARRRVVAGPDPLSRAAVKAAVHHSRSSIIAPADASDSANPASTSPPL